MALIVEDGSIVSGAESYCTVAFALTYHANLGNATWAALTEPQQEQALRRATMFMVQSYRTNWKGSRISGTQPLDWPRFGVTTDDSSIGYRGYCYVVPSDSVPLDIQKACAELALKASTSDLFPDGQQKVSAKTVGPITIKYEQGSSQRKTFDSVTALLAVYLNGRGGVNVPLSK